MACTTVVINGIGGIVCSRGQRKLRPCCVPGCGKVETARCDWPVRPVHAWTRQRTCSRAMCEEHRYSVPSARNTDFCPGHRAQYERRHLVLPGIL